MPASLTRHTAKGRTMHSFWAWDALPISAVEKKKHILQSLPLPNYRVPAGVRYKIKDKMDNPQCPRALAAAFLD